MQLQSIIFAEGIFTVIMNFKYKVIIERGGIRVGYMFYLVFILENIGGYF